MFAFSCSLPKYHWSYVVCHVDFLINQLPTPILNGKTPFELLVSKLPFLFDLKVFGSLCFASTLTHNHGKFDPRFTKCIFLGYRPCLRVILFLIVILDKYLFLDMFCFMSMFFLLPIHHLFVPTNLFLILLL